MKKSFRAELDGSAHRPTFDEAPGFGFGIGFGFGNTVVNVQLAREECDAAIRCADGIAAALWCCLYRRG